MSLPLINKLKLVGVVVVALLTIALFIDICLSFSLLLGTSYDLGQLSGKAFGVVVGIVLTSIMVKGVRREERSASRNNNGEKE